MAVKRLSLGFGFIKEDTSQHFLVVIPRSKDSDVMIYERFHWDDCEVQRINEIEDRPKAKISKYKWKLIEETLKTEFNNRLKQSNITVGKWKVGQVPVQRLLGKEMLLLVWAIEDCDPAVIPVAIRNWLGLTAEERWWLFTMTNASTGGLYDNKGWRKAIRYALTENPIDESRHQRDLFEVLFEKKNG